MQPGGSIDGMGLKQTLVLIAVLGVVAAKWTLDWAGGKRPSRSDTGDPSGWMDGDGHHDACGGYDGDCGGGGDH